MHTFTCEARVSAFVAGALLVAACAALAQGPEVYLPLETGDHWSYQSDLGTTEEMTITGEFSVLGVVTRVRLEDLVTDLVENYWTTDDSGDLFLHGAHNLMYGFQVAYQPPIRMIDAPLSQGKAWVTSAVHLYNLDGTPWGGDASDIALVVDFAGNVEVPAGSFPAFGIGFNTQTLALADKDGAEYDVFGRRVRDRVDKSDVDITEWYAAGVGIVQKTRYPGDQHLFQLTSFGLPSALRSTSWGSLKAEYRSP